MTNEKLIEEALVALMHDPEVPTGVRPHLLGGEALVIRERTDAEPIVRAALAVFEKAHTPTEDEREALREQIAYRVQTAVAYGKGVQKWGQLSDTTQDAWIAEQVALTMNSRAVSGFRRSEVPEPSAEAVIDEETDAIWQAIADALGGFGQVLNSHDETAEWVLRYLFRRTPAPQGEPSDAPTVQFVARKGGKSQALIDQMLAQANGQGIRVEVVYPQDEPSFEVPEPSAELRKPYTPTSESTDDPGGRLFRSRTYKALAERDFTGHMDEGRRTAFYEGWSAREHWESTPPEPQGEPSDATLGVMAQRFYEASGLNIPHTAKPEVVAGLRAAWEVR